MAYEKAHAGHALQKGDVIACVSPDGKSNWRRPVTELIGKYAYVRVGKFRSRFPAVFDPATFTGIPPGKWDGYQYTVWVPSAEGGED